MPDRPPAVAGTFYPAQPRALRDMVRRLLDDAESGPPAPMPRGALVPHAGYVYSGRIAASAYRCLRALRSEVGRVVLIGPAHFVPVEGVAVSAADGFDTPLGPLPVDEAGRAAALQMPGVVRDDAPHEPEHSLEVQLPFVLETLGTVPIVPLLVGRAGTAQVASLLDALWTSDTLIVVSSDLSHYLDVAAARARDSLTVTAILNRDAGGIADSDACGSYAVRPLLVAADARDMTMTLVDMGTSADAGGDPRRVVGYAGMLVG